MSEHNLDISDITMLQDSIKIVFRSFKHSKSSSVHILKARNDFLCPHTAMTNYLKLRNDIVGPLFLLNNKAVSGSFFSKKFKQLLVQLLVLMLRNFHPILCAFLQLECGLLRDYLMPKLGCWGDGIQMLLNVT